ncbi:MAG: hypothetical protein IKG01_10350, partial [Lachnospiraceae bacterium]|nr:hypothetical protein [Lachnospiraceae bacterium]
PLISANVSRGNTAVPVQSGCSQVPRPGANIIFIEKRRSYLASLQNALHFAISQSDRQCFSHEDGCFAVGNELQEQPD